MFDNTTLSNLLKYIPRNKFNNLVKKYQSDRYKKSFKTWDHLVSMLIGQLSGANSLRDIVTITNSQPQCFYHLNMNCKKIARSSISDANQQLNPRMLHELAAYLISGNKKYKRELQPLLTMLDSSPIIVSGKGSQWAKETKVRCSTQGLKLHLQFDNTHQQIEYAELTEANVNDVNVAQSLKLHPNRIYVFDKGYCDYNWWKSIIDTSSQFVTRLKKNAAYSAKENKAIPDDAKGFIVADQLITLTNNRPRAKKINQLAGIPLRLITIKHPTDHNKLFTIVSNVLDATACEIAGWYKERWSIELLFKWLKQNLKLKKFFGQSRNAIMIQIYTAIISFVLLQHYQIMQGSFMRLKDVAMIVKSQLFLRPRLYEKILMYRENKIHESGQIIMEIG